MSKINKYIDLNGNTIISLERDNLLNILMFLIANNHLSASRSGLEKRRNNREKAIQRLLTILDLTLEYADALFWKQEGIK